MLRLYTLLLCFFIVPSSFAGLVPSPEAYLGYPPGSRFTFHHRITDYFSHVASVSDKVAIIPYGSTWEGRPLLVAVVTSPGNHKNLPQIQASNLVRAGMGAISKGEKADIPIVWLSYNIHGDEASSSEAAMQMLYFLATADTLPWLDSMVVILDPCMNPDGRDRYVNWQYQTGAANPNLFPQSVEHSEDWPGGRENHYHFDLNRDWCWQTQPESRQRAALYYQWMPQIHVDFHEMKSDKATYFFPPSARPFHPAITGWQREFHTIIGKNHAKWFDKNYWLYFSKEVYDLFYPSYGDTWPSFQGAMGFTYEQTGGDGAGRAVLLANGDTLTLADRIAKHLTTGISTIESAYNNRKKLLGEFQKYFENNSQKPYGSYKTYIIKPGTHPERAGQLLRLLDQNQIQYGSPSGETKTLKGFSYADNAEINFQLSADDIVISAYQPNSLLLQVLFEPSPQLEDSLTYDLTAWALPYAYGLSCYALESRINPEPYRSPFHPTDKLQPANPYAWLVEWKDFHHARFLATAIQAGIVPSRATAPFRIGDKEFERGTLIFYGGKQGDASGSKLQKLAAESGVELFPVASGLVDEGNDLGSDQIQALQKRKVALLRGAEMSVISFGELWYYLEQDLGYPVSVLDTRFLEKVDLESFDLLILPSGNYERFYDQIMDFIETGGTVIALEKAMDLFGKSGNRQQTALYTAIERGKRSLTRNFMMQDTPATLFEEMPRLAISNSVPGSIFRVDTDPTHPLAFGMGDHFYLLKHNSTAFPLLEDSGWNVGKFPEALETHGFTGKNVKDIMPNSMAVGVEKYGRGTIIYFTDSPVIRGFWYSGKLLLANAVFYW
ncbi:MAG: M14 family metallopeptidase [Bacteroidia bacterium]